MKPDEKVSEFTITSAIDTAGAAQRTGLAIKTLEIWRCQGRGPAFVKAGRRVVYRVCDLDEWLARNVRNSTSQPDAA
jgi:hypothetical protein